MVVFEELYWTEHSGVVVANAHHLMGVVSRDPATAVCATHLVSSDVDAVYRRVLASHAEVLTRPDQTSVRGRPSGRAFTLRDPWGNLWTVATHRGCF